MPQLTQDVDPKVRAKASYLCEDASWYIAHQHTQKSLQALNTAGVQVLEGETESERFHRAGATSRLPHGTA